MYHFEPLTAYLDHEEEIFGIPAVDLCIMKEGKVIYRHKAGHSDPQKTKPVSEQDLYWIYSCTKISTCTAAMRLIQDGKMSLDDPVSKYLPEYANLTVVDGDTVKPAETVLTVRHLMCMSGGLDYDSMRGSVPAVLDKLGEQADTVSIVKAFADGPMLFNPGKGYQYSLCHDVLAAVIEVASGMKYSEYLNQVIFEPLGMKDTTFHPSEEQIGRISALYRYNSEQNTFDLLPSTGTRNLPSGYESGGGGLVSSVNDYLKLTMALANKGTGTNGYQVLKPETIELFTTPQLDETRQKQFSDAFEQMKGYTYALGVRVFQDNSGSTAPIGHFGWDGAAGFYVLMDPVNNLTYVYAQDVLNSGVTFHQIHNQLRDLVYLCLRE